MANTDLQNLACSPVLIDSQYDNNSTGVHGVAHIDLTQRDGSTSVSNLYQKAPLRVMQPRPSDDSVFEAVLANTSGGIVGGDRLDVQISTGSETRSLITTQAAEKVYRSLGSDSIVTTTINADSDSWVEWMPQETIFFNGARFRRRTALNVDTDARVMAGEIIVFGRIASGEVFERGLVHDEWRVRINDKLVWADNMHLSDDIDKITASSAGFGGSRATATLAYVSSDAGQFLDKARKLIEDENLYVGATCIENVLIVRWLGEDVSALRSSYTTFWKQFRSLAGGLSPVLPTIWQT